MSLETDARTESRPPPLRLKLTEGNAQGTEIQVDEEFVIGRLAEGEGRLADDLEISRQHARIFRGDGGYLVEDLGSMNGTFVNGRSIARAETLSVGDKVGVGGTTLVVQVSSSPPLDTAPAEAPAAETPAAEAPAAADTGGSAAAAPPPLSLRLEYGPGPGEARLLLGEGSNPVELVHEQGGWRVRGG